MLAIIIPYFKLTFFEATLQSLAAQTCQDFKVYIGDDASPEDPKVLLEQYHGQFDFVYQRFEINIGCASLTRQWERCIALSDTEKWLMILGDDDVLGKNVVEEFYKNLPEIEEVRSNVVRFATRVINGEGKAISGLFEHPKLEKATDSFWRKFKGETRSSLSEYIFSRVNYSKYGFKDYPLAWHSDDRAWLDFKSIPGIYSINNCLIFIRISAESLSGKNDFQSIKSKTTQLFYEDIVRSYSSSFSKMQRLKIIQNVESYYFRHKEFYLFLKICKWHIVYTDIFNLFKFFRRIYLNI